jgi:hypothetical protein
MGKIAGKISLVVEIVMVTVLALKCTSPLSSRAG